MTHFKPYPCPPPANPWREWAIALGLVLGTIIGSSIVTTITIVLLDKGLTAWAAWLIFRIAIGHHA